jgi:hypothetical protein
MPRRSQGLAFAPLTAAGLSGVAAGEAGAASGLVNTAHQLGSALGLATLVAFSASARIGASDPVAALASQVSVALTGGSALLALCLVLAVILVVPWKVRRRGESPEPMLDGTAPRTTPWPARPVPATKEYA